jgi:hypothetical protein
MAIDYLHRLIERGPHKGIVTFRREIYRRYRRKIGRESWIEIVPFSFAALYEIAPAARRVEPGIPCDAFDMSVWPTHRLGRARAEVRYQFHTRNMEMADLIKVLARARPGLTFTLLTLCFDDSSIELYWFSRGRSKKWKYPERRTDFHWNRAIVKFGLSEDNDEGYEEAEQWTDEEMMHEALNHWNQGNPSAQSGRYRWWNRPVLRDLETEMQLAAYEFAETIKSEAPRRKSKTARRRRAR